MAFSLVAAHHRIPWMASSNPFFPSISLLHRLPPSPSLLNLPPIRASERPDASSAVDEDVGVVTLRRFVGLNSGNWNGIFYQFDTHGNVLNRVRTRLAASAYGEDELLSLVQTLYIKQAPSKTSISSIDDDDGSGSKVESEWEEYKIKETNMFTVDQYQQIGFFPDQKAFCLRYQTAGMLENVLRIGVLGEDDIGEESPRDLKLPSYRPSLVCESCLHYLNRNVRTRAFHTMDPKGFLEMLLIFVEQTEGGGRGEEAFISSHLDEDGSSEQPPSQSRLVPFLGHWKGYSMTRRSGVYGSTIVKADTKASLEVDENGILTQDIISTTTTDSGSGGDITTNVHWTGNLTDNLITFDGGYEVTLLPGGMYMGCPSNASKSVANSQSFHLELCWTEEDGRRRQRLVRTYDAEGLVVSSTYFYEVKV